ncbi:MAG TPA: hypothetical protein VLJ84_06240, partial [Usitatibacter sp.]|nr:hypothetical protein [Usitatibacter sp.]
MQRLHPRELRSYRVVRLRREGKAPQRQGGDTPWTTKDTKGTKHQVGQLSLRGGYFSPASMRTFRMFCLGGSGQVV